MPDTEEERRAREAVNDRIADTKSSERYEPYDGRRQVFPEEEGRNQEGEGGEGEKG